MVYTMENGNKVRISDDYITKAMEKLDITKEQAIEMYLEDEGYTSSEEVEELTKKAKENKINKGAKGEKKSPTKRERKPNDEKRALITELFNTFVASSAENVTIVNPEREVSFNIGENSYSFTLICHRNTKKE